MERKNIEPKEFINELRKKRLNSKTKALVQKNGHKYLLHVSDVLENYETNLNMVFTGYNTPEKIRKYKIPGDTVEKMKISFKKKLSGIAKKIEDQAPKESASDEKQNHEVVSEQKAKPENVPHEDSKVKNSSTEEEKIIMDFDSDSDEKDFSLTDDDLNIDAESDKQVPDFADDKKNDTEEKPEKKQSLKDILNESLTESSKSDSTLTSQTNNGIILSDNNNAEGEKVKTTTIDQAEVETDIKQKTNSSEETEASMSEILTSRNEALEELVEQFKTRLVQATQVINDLNNTISEKNQKISNLETGADEEQKRAVSEALVLAQEMKNSIIETANKKSEEIIQEAEEAAHTQATEIISNAKLQADEESKRAEHAQREYTETLTGVSELIARLKSVETGEFAIDNMTTEDVDTENDLHDSVQEEQEDQEESAPKDNEKDKFTKLDALFTGKDTLDVDKSIQKPVIESDSDHSSSKEESKPSLVDDSISQFDIAIANIHK